MGILFFCYSKELKLFLETKGFRYEVCALHPNTKNIFWAYLKSASLDDAINEWRAACRAQQERVSLTYGDTQK